MAPKVSFEPDNVPPLPVALDARLVAGDQGPSHALWAGAYRENVGPERLNDFQRLLVKARRLRHERLGETVDVLEPNIKSGAGGLRDINTGLGAAKVRFGIEGIAALASRQLAARRQQDQLAAARSRIRSRRESIVVAVDEVIAALEPPRTPEE